MTYLGQVVVAVVDLTGRVRVGEVSRREVEQCEVDALTRLCGQFNGTRRQAVRQRVEAVRRRGGRRPVAVSQDRHAAAATTGRSVSSTL